MRVEIAELIENVTDEILCYENAEKLAEQWAVEFKAWLNKNKNHKDVFEEKGKTYFKIGDEGEIFEMADSYLDAAEENRFHDYWTDF